ncbi:MAG: CgeB family protein [Thainema sp.]
MRIVLFYHSLISDWNHGNAHFLRGVVTELLERGHDVQVYEPAQGWSLQSLLAEQGETAIADFQAAYPTLKSTLYSLETLDLDTILADTDLVLVHEWNDPQLVQQIGQHHHRYPRYRLLFHDTHHRSVSDPKTMAAYDLRHYDGVLAFGCVIRDLYLQNGWAKRAWTWHEAADIRHFQPIEVAETTGDLVWIGNWGDDERTAELHEFLLRPVQDLQLKARIYGVRYPDTARQALSECGIEYAGWLPNYQVPTVFSQFKVTVHVPRRYYASILPGIPTIRVFEALACGVPLVSAPWDDLEDLFEPGRDFLVAHNGEEMKAHLRCVLADAEFAQALADRGRQTILERHTCGHRVDELLAIYEALTAEALPAQATS